MRAKPGISLDGKVAQLGSDGLVRLCALVLSREPILSPVPVSLSSPTLSSMSRGSRCPGLPESPVPVVLIVVNPLSESVRPTMGGLLR